jgi:hypothetical protein
MPAEVTCEHCGASVAIPPDVTGGVACTYCQQWIVLGARPRPRREERATIPRSSFPLVWVLLGCVVLGLGILMLWRAPAPPKGAPATVASAESPSTSAPIVSSASAKPSYFTELEKFGGHGGLAGQFLDARTLAVDGNGNVWVADFDSPRVQKLDAHGHQLLLVNRDADDLPVVTGIAADAKGNVFLVADGELTPIVVLSSDDGRVIRKIKPTPPDERWGELAVDQTGSLYAIAEDKDSRYSVVKMDAAGKVLTRYEKTKKDDHASGRPAIDGEAHLYVPHEFERKIYVHDAKGAIINRWGSMGQGDGDFDLGVEGLAWDFHGHVLVANYGVQVFDADGRYVTRLSERSAGWSVFDLALAPDGSLYVMAGDDTIHHYALHPDALAK